jgi:hypothetical protein
MRSTKLTDDARAMGRAVIAGRARQQTADVAPTIKALRATTSLRAIAAELTKRGIPTASGRGACRGKIQRASGVVHLPCGAQFAKTISFPNQNLASRQELGLF